MGYSFEGNRVVRDTGAEFPIFQAPIGFISRSSLAGAVSAAGGMGLMETMLMSVDQMDAEFELVRQRTNRPVGIHFLISFLDAHPDHKKAVLDWALSGRTGFVTTGFGDPTAYIPRIKDAGVTVYHMTDNLNEALRAQDAGVDGLVLGGAERGGGGVHNNLHTFALLQKVRERTDLPIVASGGIVDGRGMAGAFALGAEGILMGTRFMASEESTWHDGFKQAIVDTEETIYVPSKFRGFEGKTFLAARTPFAEAVVRGEAGDWSSPYAANPGPMFAEGRTDTALVGVGESAVLIHEVKSAAEIINETVAQFWQEVDRLAGMREGRHHVSAGRVPAPPAAPAKVGLGSPPYARSKPVDTAGVSLPASAEGNDAFAWLKR